MRTVHLLITALAFVTLNGWAAPALAVQTTQPADGVQLLIRRLEQIVQAGDAAAYTALLSAPGDAAKLEDFTSTEFGQASTRTVIQERDREPIKDTAPGSAFRLMVDVFSEFGNRARAASWRLDLKRVGEPGSDREWAIRIRSGCQRSKTYTGCRSIRPSSSPHTT